MRISDWSSDVCSSDLLANFPSEADLVPGARPIEVREREILARKVLGEMLEEAEGHKDRQVLDAVAQFTRSEERRVGKSVSVRVDLGGRRIIKQKNNRVNK